MVQDRNHSDYMKPTVTQHSPATLAIRLTEGQLEVFLWIPGVEEPILAMINSTGGLNDGNWHQVHVRVTNSVSKYLSRSSNKCQLNFQTMYFISEFY